MKTISRFPEVLKMTNCGKAMYIVFITLCTINVYANQSPIAICNDITIGTADNCQASAEALLFDNGSYDPDAGDMISYSVSPSGPYTLGVTNVILKVTDQGGLFSTCSTTVTVEDDTAPVFDSGILDWTLASEHLSSNDISNDRMGRSVSISGDYAIVGAHLEDNVATNAGAAYIFQRINGTWEEIQKIEASEGATEARFGFSVSISGDYAAIGASGDSGKGAVYIFYNNGTSWVQQKKIQLFVSSNGDNFGTSVSISGDYVVIGANGVDTSSAIENHGAAYIFKRNDSDWLLQQTLLAFDKGSNDNFGLSVAISGDNIMVGAPGENILMGAVYAYVKTGATYLLQQKITQTIGLDRFFGYSVSISGDHVVIGSPGRLDLPTLSAGAAYIYKYNGIWSDEQKITPTDGEANDRFGIAVSIAGSRVVVGSYGEDTGGSNAGAIYTFQSSVTGWVETYKIQAVDKEAEDFYGTSVAISDNDILVGAPRKDSDNENVGKLYTYDATIGDLLPITRLCQISPETPIAIDNCGGIISGVPSVSFPISTVGTTTVVWTYTDEDGNSNTQSQELTIIGESDGVYCVAPIANPNNLMISANDNCEGIASAEDFNNISFGSFAGDVLTYRVTPEGPYPIGTTTVVFEVTSENGLKDDVFTSITVTDTSAPVPDEGEEDWNAAAQSIEIESDEGAGVGISSSVSGDYAIVGAHNGRNGSIRTGSAYFFKREGSTWVQDQKVNPPDGAVGDFFGRSVSISGNYAIVGAYGEDDESPIASFNNIGAAYVYERIDDSWILQEKLIASDREGSDWFGWSVSISEDFAFVGCRNDDFDPLGIVDNKVNCGSIYIYKRNGSRWIDEQRIIANDKDRFDFFGSSVSVSGNFAVVGAPGEDTGGDAAGKGYVYYYNGTEWILSRTLFASDRQAGDNFGIESHISGNYIIVSSMLEDTGGDDSGAAYVYYRADGQGDWVQQQKLQASDKEAEDLFGRAVSISDEYAIIGASKEDSGADNAGSVYMFKRDGAVWTEELKVQAEDKQEEDLFGRSVAIDGDDIFIGASGADTYGDNSGAIYVVGTLKGDLPNANAYCSFTPQAPTATENCGDIITGITDTPFPITTIGTTEIIWTYTDAVGNETTQKQNIILEGNGCNPPEASCQNIIINTDENCQGSTAAEDFDNGSSDLDEGDVLSFSVSPEGPYNLGVTSVVLTVTDITELYSTCTATVTVVDNNLPVISCPANITVSPNEGFCELDFVNLGVATATDNCSDVTPTHVALDVYSLGDNYVTWTVDDGNGNLSTCIQTVTVVDNEDPIINCPGDVTVSADAGSCVATFVELGNATAIDNCGEVSIYSSTPEGFSLGINIVTWTADDGHGNLISCEQLVTVVDTEEPILSCPSSIIVFADAESCEATSVDLGNATATDNCTDIVTTNDSPGVYVLGENLVTWTADDGNGNVVTCVQIVTVIDNQPPTITCPVDLTVESDDGSCVATMVDLGTATATDNCSDISPTNDSSGEFVLGANPVNWTADDGNGNVVTCVQMVTVIDTQDPVISCPADVTILADSGECTASLVDLVPPVASDNCGEESLSFTNNLPEVLVVGETYSVTWTVADESGNAVACMHLVTCASLEIIDYYGVEPSINSSTSLVGGNVLASITQVAVGDIESAVLARSGYYLSTDDIFDDSDILLETNESTFSTESSTEIETASLTLPIATDIGDYYILFVSDDNDVHYECMEENNVQALPISVVLPDFYGADAELSANEIAPGEILSASSDQSVTALLEDVHLKSGYYLSTDDVFDDSDVELAIDFSTLSATDLDDIESAQLTIPESTVEGNYYILIITDPDNAEEEQNENNNTIAFALSVTNTPATYDDFYIQDHSLDKEVAAAGEQIKATCYQWYDGTSMSTLSVDLGYYYSTDDVWDVEDLLMGTDISTLSSSDLNDKESIYFNLPNDAESGTRYIIFVTDYESGFEESDETNNIEMVAIEIGEPLPVENDFSISSAAVNNINPDPGSSITMSFDSDYVGTSGSILTVSSKYYLSTDMVYDNSDILLGSEVSTLSASDTSDPESKTTVLSNSIADGFYYILFITDFTDDFEETDENNNIQTVAISIGNVTYTTENTPLGIAEQIEKTAATNNIVSKSNVDVDLKLYPNPTTSVITLDYNTTFNANQIMIVNSIGQLVFTKSINESNRIQSIDVSNFTNGIYRIVLMDNTSKSKLTTSFIKI